MYNLNVDVPALITEDKILDLFAKYRCQVPSEMSQDTWEHCTTVADVAQVTEETFQTSAGEQAGLAKGIRFLHQ